MLSTSTIRYTLENRHGESETFQTLEEIPNIEITRTSIQMILGGNDAGEIFMAPVIKGYDAPYLDERTDEIGTEHYIYYEESKNEPALTRNFKLYNDKFKELLLEKFPTAHNWLDAVAQTPVDIQGLLESIGFRVIATDLGTEAYSKRIGGVIFMNSNINENARRYDMALRIGHLILGDETTPEQASDVPTSEAITLPEDVKLFLTNIGFKPIVKNSLRDAINALNNYTRFVSDETDPVVSWYATEEAEQTLALAYIHGFK